MGDDAVILMDLDAVGAHIILMCFAGSSPEGFRIQNKDEILRKILRGVGASDWDRIKPQIMTAWDVSDDGEWIIQRGMQRTLLKQKSFSKTQSERAKERWKGCQTGAGRDAKRVPNGCSSSSSSSTSTSTNNTITRKTRNSIISIPKILHGEYVYLSSEEHQKFTAQFGTEFLDAAIAKLNGWIGSNPIPKRIVNGKNAAACFRSWVFDSIAEQQAKAQRVNGSFKQPHKTHQDQILETMNIIFEEAKRNEN